MTRTSIARRTGRPTRAETQRRESVRRQAATQSVRHRRKTLPEYLEASEVAVMLEHGVSVRHKLIMQIQWRAGLRVSEVLALDSSDLRIDADPPHIFVRAGKGDKDRLVPMHPDLRRDIQLGYNFEFIGRGPLFEGTTRQSAWEWAKEAQKRAEADGTLPPGRKIGTHTFRHSAARHWLANAVPINVVSRWLGHASLQTTLPYLEILPDPLGQMERIP